MEFTTCYNLLNFITEIYTMIEDKKNNFNSNLIILEIKELDYLDDLEKQEYIDIILKLENKTYAEALEILNEEVNKYIEDYLACDGERRIAEKRDM